MTSERTPPETKKKMRKKPAPPPPPAPPETFKVGDFVAIPSGEKGVIVKHDDSDGAPYAYDVLLAKSGMPIQSGRFLRKLTKKEMKELKASTPEPFAKDDLVYATSAFAPLALCRVVKALGSWVYVWHPDGNVIWDLAANFKKYEPGTTYTVTRFSAGGYFTFHVKPVIPGREKNCWASAPSNECDTDDAPRFGLVASSLPAPAQSATTHRITIEHGARVVIYDIEADTIEQARAKAIAQHTENNT